MSLVEPMFKCRHFCKCTSVLNHTLAYISDGIRANIIQGAFDLLPISQFVLWSDGNGGAYNTSNTQYCDTALQNNCPVCQHSPANNWKLSQYSSLICQYFAFCVVFILARLSSRRPAAWPGSVLLRLLRGQSDVPVDPGECPLRWRYRGCCVTFLTEGRSQLCFQHLALVARL